ncbi:hypothetical protein J6590_036627 [Homalodisca vitripennis]|nr:hypothetical protein J6590_036627 [Homalodisca vitripennis]
MMTGCGELAPIGRQPYLSATVALLELQGQAGPSGRPTVSSIVVDMYSVPQYTFTVYSVPTIHCYSELGADSTLSQCTWCRHTLHSYSVPTIHYSTRCRQYTVTVYSVPTIHFYSILGADNTPSQCTRCRQYTVTVYSVPTIHRHSVNK